MVRSYRFALALAACVAASAMTLPGRASAQTEIPCANHNEPRMAGWSNDGIGLATNLGLPAGRYAPALLPPAPATLVVMFHGHGNDSCSWRKHLLQAASFGGGGNVIAVAMDYTGQAPRTIGTKTYDNYGWNVKEGAADSITAADYFLSTYPSITKVIAFGISMGGNSSGLAVAAKALRPAPRSDAGQPLFDYWIDVEGVNSILDEYAYVRALAPGVASAAQAQAEIEEENGGPIESAPQAYLETNNVSRAPDMVSLKGAVVVNGFDDSQVPTEQSDEMTAALRAVGVPTHAFNVVGSGGAESGSTYTENAMTPLFGAAGLGAYNSPLAGHGWEGSDTQLVIETGFEQLWNLLGGGTITDGLTIVPGVAGY